MAERQTIDTSRETWKRAFGPRHYAFQHADAIFIILDNVYYHGHDPANANSGRYRGLIGAEQLQFVRNVLAHVPHDRLVVLSMHIPLMNYQSAATAADNTADRRALLGLLSTRPHTVSFAGHMHLTEHHYFGVEAGFFGCNARIITMSSPRLRAAGGADRRMPAAFPQPTPRTAIRTAIIYWPLTAAITRHVSFPQPASQRRNCVQPSRGPRSARRIGLPSVKRRSRDSELVVNVFDGGPATRVSYSIAGVTTKPYVMQRVASPDPHVARVFAGHAPLQKPWMRALSSSHIWRAPLPAHLLPGAYCAKVQAEDEYGRRLSAHVLFEVTRLDVGT